MYISYVHVNIIYNYMCIYVYIINIIKYVYVHVYEKHIYINMNTYVYDQSIHIWQRSIATLGLQAATGLSRPPFSPVRNLGGVLWAFAVVQHMGWGTQKTTMWGPQDS